MTDDELAALVDAYGDGRLDPAAAERIAAALVAGDPDGEAFARHVACAGLLAQACDGADGEAVVAALRERMRAEASPSRFMRAVRRRRRRSAQLTMAPALTAALAASLLLAWWLVARGPHDVAAEPEPGSVVVSGSTPGASDGLARPGDRIVAGTTPTTLRFPDGTTLVLDPGSTAWLEAGDGKRLRLTGSLSAVVTPQPADRPLVIAAGQAIATVVGTRFTLATTPDGARLAVSEGSVRLALAGVVASVAAGDGVIAVAGGGGGARIHRLPPLALDPRTYGAIADDDGDDAPAIQAAIAAASDGGTVLIPPGRWRLATPLRPARGVRLLGESRDRCVFAPAAGAVDGLLEIDDAAQVEICEIGLDGELTTRGPAVFATHGGDLRLRWLAIRDLAADSVEAAIWLVGDQGDEGYGGGVVGALVADCVIERVGLRAEWGAGIRVGWGCRDVVIERNRIVGTGRGGILANDGVGRLTIRGNEILDTAPGSDIRIGIEVWKDCDDATIEDNAVDHRISLTGSARVALRRNRIGVGATDRSDLALFLNGEDLLIADNHIDGGHEVGMHCDGDGNRRHWLTRNRVMNVPGVGLAVRAGESIVAIGNEFTACDEPAVALIEEAVDGVVLANIVDGVADRPFTGAALTLIAPATAASGAMTAFSVGFADGRAVAHAMWDVGEGPALIGTHVTHAFIAGGPRRVAVMVWDETGRAGTAAAVVGVTASVRP